MKFKVGDAVWDKVKGQYARVKEANGNPTLSYPYYVGNGNYGRCAKEDDLILSGVLNKPSPKTEIPDFWIDGRGYSTEEIKNIYKTPSLSDVLKEPDGGPAEYYDFPKGAITLNDLIEHGNMCFHRGNIFKACWRYGTKKGVTKEYDARKIIYSGARLLKQLVGVKELRKTLERMLDDPQFK
jgi:hypothetical protein